LVPTGPPANLASSVPATLPSPVELELKLPMGEAIVRLRQAIEDRIEQEVMPDYWLRGTVEDNGRLRLELQATELARRPVRLNSMLTGTISAAGRNSFLRGTLALKQPMSARSIVAATWMGALMWAAFAVNELLGRAGVQGVRDAAITAAWIVGAAVLTRTANRVPREEAGRLMVVLRQLLA
jgi:hypothetical protein